MPAPENCPRTGPPPATNGAVVRALHGLAAGAALLLAACAPLPTLTTRSADPPGSISASSTATATSRAARALPPLRLDQVDPVALANRVTWGVDSAVLERITAMGAGAWLSQQLQPPAPQWPAPVLAALAALDGPADASARPPLAERLTELARQRAAGLAEARDDPQRNAANNAYQAGLSAIARADAQRTLLRALHSPNQVQEVMTWFWLNHFSVFRGKNDVRAMIGDYEDQAIRPHALGRFRDLLGAAALHPAMLRYLDNDQNAARRINENFARELLELHTLGVNGGYAQRDVQELARILTGVGVVNANALLRRPAEAGAVRRGLFEFDPRRHDFGSKTLLGQTIAGTGLGEIEQALDLLAAHPATARHISRKLAMQFVADDPPAALIDTLAARFLANGGDLADLLHTLFASPAFVAALQGAPGTGVKFKDPMTWLLSTVRLVHDRQPITNVAPLIGWLDRLGQPLHGRRTPDGYPLEAAAWTGSGQLNERFEAARAFAAGPPALLRPAPAVAAGTATTAAPGTATTPARPPLPRLADSPVVRAWEPQFGNGTRLALRQARTPYEWNAFFLSSPEMMRR